MSNVILEAERGKFPGARRVVVGGGITRFDANYRLQKNHPSIFAGKQIWVRTWDSSAAAFLATFCHRIASGYSIPNKSSYPRLVALALEQLGPDAIQVWLEVQRVFEFATPMPRLFLDGTTLPEAITDRYRQGIYSFSS